MSAPRDETVYLHHMLDAARKIQDGVGGRSREGYDSDFYFRMGIAHLIQIIGEAARCVSEDVRNSIPEIPWKQVTGMRHRIVHDYINIDFDVVWDTATIDVPVLITALTAALVRRDITD